MDSTLAGASGREDAHQESRPGEPSPRPSRWAVRSPWTVIIIVVACTLAAAPGLLRLELRTDGHALVPPRDPVVLADEEIRDHFGLGDPIVVLIETTHPDGIYNPATLELVDRLTTALGELDGVAPEQLTSLATEKRDRVFTGTLDFKTFLQPMPRTVEQIEEVRSDVEATRILDGTLVGADHRSTAIIVSVPITVAGADAPEEAGEPRQSLDRTELYRRIREVAEPYATSTDSIVVVGAPVAEALLGTHIIEDLVVLVPLSLLVICGVIWFGCRRLWGVALALTEVGAAMVWTFGLMGWLGVPVYLTTAVLPVILTTIGLADEVHLLWHYQHRLETWPETASHRGAVSATMASMTRPVVLTSMTTSIGFLSFLASEIPPVRFFGLFACVGILFCMVWSLTVIPAAMALLPAAALARPAKAGRTVDLWLGRWLVGWQRRAGLTLGVLALLTVVAALGTWRVVVQDSWIDGFSSTSPFRIATERVNQQMHGTHLLLAHLSFEPGGDEAEAGSGGSAADPGRRLTLGAELASKPLLQPANLEAIGELEAFIQKQPGVGGVLGTHSHMVTVAYLWLARRDGARSIPHEAFRVRKLIRRFEQGRGLNRRREVIDDDLHRTVVTVFLKDANYLDTAELMRSIRSYVSEHLEPLGARLDFAGDVAVSQAMIPAIVRTQVLSLGLAILGAFLCLCALYRSFWIALAGVAPTAVAVLWVFGGSGWLGIPLGVATSMFCAITLGIGVDYAIHFLERWRSAAARGAGAATEQAVLEAGPPILFDTLAIALGFGLLILSQVPANARLGLLVAIALGSACLLTLGGLAAALRLVHRAGEDQGGTACVNSGPFR